MRLPIKAQIRTQKNVKCVHMIKCAHFLPKITCVLHVRKNYAKLEHGVPPPVWHYAIIIVTMNNILVYFVVSIKMTENAKFHYTRTDDA